MPEFYNPSGDTHGRKNSLFGNTNIPSHGPRKLNRNTPVNSRGDWRAGWMRATQRSGTNLDARPWTKAIHHAAVIMPNHVHLLFTPHAPLEKLMQSWNGIPARRIGMDSIWQKNYRDTLISDTSHFTNAVRDIRRN